MSLQMTVIVKRAFMGMMLGILLAMFSLLFKKRKLVRTGVGIEVTYLHVDKHLFGLVRKMRPMFKGRMSVYNHIVHVYDALVGAVIQSTPMDTMTVMETFPFVDDAGTRKAVQDLVDRL
jgi:hypothetical protein